MSAEVGGKGVAGVMVEAATGVVVAAGGPRVGGAGEVAAKSWTSRRLAPASRARAIAAWRSTCGVTAGPAAGVLDLAAVTAHDELGLWVVPALAGDAQRCGVQLTVVPPIRHLRGRLRRLSGRPIDITDTAPRRAQRADPDHRCNVGFSAGR